MPKNAVKLAQTFGDVHISDSTFQTNKHGFPLLDICVFGAQGETITVAFALLKKDELREDDYVWILEIYRKIVVGSDIPLPGPGVWVVDRELAFFNALRRVFPEVFIIICFWHIEKAIEGHLKSNRIPHRITAEEWYA